MTTKTPITAPNIALEAALVQFLPKDADGKLSARLVNVTTSGGSLELDKGITAQVSFTADKPYRNGGTVFFDAQGQAIGFEPTPEAKAPKTGNRSGSMAPRPNL